MKYKITDIMFTTLNTQLGIMNSQNNENVINDKKFIDTEMFDIENDPFI